MEKSKGTRYSEEFKQGAVKLVLDSHDAEKVQMRQLEEENRQLRKEKADLEDTVEILKKAAAIFSQSQRKSTK